MSPVQELRERTHLYLSTYKKTIIDFTLFPNLVDCALHWQPGFSSIFNVKGLRILFLGGYYVASSCEIAKLKELETLRVKDCSIKVFTPFSSLTVEKSRH